MKELKSRSNYDNNIHLLVNKFNFNTTNIVMSSLRPLTRYSMTSTTALVLIAIRSDKERVNLIATEYQLSTECLATTQQLGESVSLVSWELPNTVLQERSFLACGVHVDVIVTGLSVSVYETRGCCVDDRETEQCEWWLELFLVLF